MIAIYKKVLTYFQGNTNRIESTFNFISSVTLVQNYSTETIFCMLSVFRAHRPELYLPHPLLV